MSRYRSRAALMALAVLVAPALAACGAGANAATTRFYSPSDGVIKTSSDGSLRVLNALVVAPSPGTAAPTTSTRTGVVAMSIVDLAGDGDELRSVTPSSGTAQLAGMTRLVPGRGLTFGGPGATSTVIINGMTELPGQTIGLVLAFAQAGNVDLRTVVMPANGEYAALTAPASPGATPTVTATGSSTVGPTPTPATSASINVGGAEPDSSSASPTPSG